MTKTLHDLMGANRNFLVATLLFLLFSLVGFSQNIRNNYIYDEPGEVEPVTYQEIVGTDVYSPPLGSTWTNQVRANLPIGFTFYYNGAAYTELNVSSNGFITFGVAPGTGVATALSTNISGAGGVIAAYARVLVSSGATSAITYELQGSAPNQIFVVQWKDALRNITPSDIFNLQIRLYEGSNTIEIWHKAFPTAPALSTATAANNGQVGIRGSSTVYPANVYNRRGPNSGGSAASPVFLPPTFETAANNTQFIINQSYYNNTDFRLRYYQRCIQPNTPVVSSVGSTTAVVNWSPAYLPTPADGYEWMVTSDGLDPNEDTPTAIEASGTTTATSINPLTGLPGGTTMVFWVRASCGGGQYSNWVSSTSFATTCLPSNVPYFLGFTGAQLPDTMAPCTSQIAVAPSLPWVVNENQPGMNGRHLQYTQSGANAANAYFFTQGVNLTAGQAYRISYRYGSQNLSTISNRMEVRYGTAESVAGMTLPIDNHPDFRGSPFLNTAVFVAPTTDVYYFGFRVYSLAGQGNVWLDDILVEESNCTQPQNVTVGTVSSNGAFLSWDPVVPTPPNGYQYYVSTVATPPTPSTAPTGTVAANFINLTGLLGSTPYYFWVRSNCSSTERSIWSLVQTFTTSAPIPYCIPEATTVAPNHSFITNFTTTGGLTNINNSSSGYATSTGYSDFTQFAVTQVVGGAVGFSLSQTSGGHGIAIWVDWNQDGVFQATERVFNTTAYQFATSQTGTFNVPGAALLGNTRMRVMIDYWAPNPNNPCVINLNGVRRGEVEDYTFIVAPAPPVLTLSANSSIQCAGDNSPVISITSTLGDYNSYVWTPSTGVTDLGGGNYQFAANSTVNYTLTASQTSAPFSINTVTYTYNAVAPPTPITITPSSAVVCETGPAVALTATGGIVSGVVALEENFNGGAPEWDFVNNSSGGTSGPAFAAWTIRNSPYVVNTPTNFWGTGPFVSNDNSSFVFTNSDSQGSGAITSTELISPVFSLAGFTNASLSFWHFFFAWPDSFARVEISTNGGATWLPGNILATYTTDQGLRNNFTNVNINLNAYVGQNNLRIRFRYNAQWGFGWAIDNVRIEGAAATQVFWSPAAGLFTNPAGTIPYNPAVAATTVYALPGTNTVYTATVRTPAPYNCETTQTVEVTRNVITQGVVSADQSFCSGVPAAITLTGHVGSVVRWESASNAAFTVGVAPIANVTTTLTGAEMLPITDIKFFRAIVGNGGCEKPTNAVYVLLESNTFDGSSWSNIDPPYSGERAIINVVGSYTINSNLEACSLSIVSGTITVASGVTISLDNELVVGAGASIVFENNSSLLQVNSAIPNSGNITYKRNSTGMYLYDYTYWSSPVEAQDLFTFSPFTNAIRKYEWDENIQDWRQLFVSPTPHAPGNVFSTPGRGFIIRAPGGGPLVFNSHTSGLPRVIFPGEFVGVPNNGTVTIPTSNNFPGWNLLGNPYPSALDVHAFLIDPANAHLDKTVRYWTHNIPITNNVYNSSDYATYNFTGSNVTQSGTGSAGPTSGFNPNLNVPGRYMASGQGFVIYVLGGNGPGMATFRNSHRAAGNNTMFFRMALTDAVISAADAIDLQERHRVWLSMSNGQNLQKSLLVGYVEGATNSYDNGYDGKFAASGYGLEFYSLLEAESLTIQGRVLPFDVTDTVPLGYFAQQAGSYTIELPQFDGLFENQEVYVEDLLTGVIHPLKESGYSFVTAPGRYDNRFVLRYTNETLSVNTPQFGEHHVVLYKENASLLIQTQEAEMSEVVLYDMSGRRLASQQGDLGTLVRFDQLGIAQQVLLVEIVTRDRGTVFKKYVY